MKALPSFFVVIIMASPIACDSKGFSKEDMHRLLSYLEGELQARDVIIAALKTEKTKHLLYQAKYGRLGSGDALNALQRDSLALNDDKDFDESEVSHMYETQLNQLERLIVVQRRCHNRSKQVLASTERRHARNMRELEEEQQRSVANAAQGDDLCALLEKERTRLRQQLEYEQKENDNTRKEVEKLEKRLMEEKERHKSMVLFLINERKQMLLKMHELRVKKDTVVTGGLESNLLAEMRKELLALRAERDQLNSTLCSTMSDMNALREVLRSQGENLALMRNNILTKTRQHANHMKSEDCHVASQSKNPLVALTYSKTEPGQSASTSRIAQKSRISSSSTFPSNERATSSRASPHVMLRAHNDVIVSTAKRHPREAASFGVERSSASTITRKLNDHPSPIEHVRPINVHVTNGKIKSYITEPEIEQLGAVIDSMNPKIVGSNLKDTRSGRRNVKAEDHNKMKNF